MASTNTSLPVIGLLGAGRMGRSIALAFALGGHNAVLIDIKPRDAQAFKQLQQDALAEIQAGLDAMVSIGALPANKRDEVASRIRLVDRAQAPKALEEIDILFEGVSETLEAKQSAFAYSCKYLRHDTIIASTTSTILSTELAKSVAHPERFLNAHWLNPAFLVPIVELSPHAGTSEDVVTRLTETLRSLGKKPIRCNATPGYVVPRLQSLIMNEAARMVEEGVASAADIDEAVRFGFGFRYTTIGAVEFIDFGGLDILYHANRYLTTALGERYRLAPIVEQYMAAGHLGLKSGKGFYDWSDSDGANRRMTILQRQYDLLKYLGVAPELDAAHKTL